MYYIRKADQRGHFNHGWLNTYHTFSFADYIDRAHMGFRNLRVINEDTIAGGAGFPFHGHKDMEILTYVISGTLEHQDTLGNKETLSPYEVQRMSAGTGIRHAEYNHHEDVPVHLLQIWILPEKEGIEPGYEQKSFKEQIQNQKLTLVASPGADGSSLSIHQDAKVYVGQLKQNEKEKFEIAKGRHVWIQMVKGELKVNDLSLKTGDGVGISDEPLLNLEALTETEFLLFDLN